MGGDPTLKRQSDVWGGLCDIFDGDRLIVGHNFVFDLICYLAWSSKPDILELILQALDDGRILDTQCAHRLITIETGTNQGKTGLGVVAPQYGLTVPKDIEHNGRVVRLSYGHLMGVPIDEYPQPYVDYAKDDTRLNLMMFERMVSKNLIHRDDLAMVTRTAFAAAMTSAWGIRCDPDRVQKLENQARSIMDRIQGVMLSAGLMRREKRSVEPVKTERKIRALVAESAGILDKVDEKMKWCHSDTKERDALQNEGLLTDKFFVSIGKNILAKADNPLLVELAEYGEWAYVYNKDLKIFRNAIETPFHTRFGFTETLRWTSSKPNQQNFARKVGIRECMRPYLGAFVATDYVGLENGTLAQVIKWVLGRGGCADRYNSGWDEHAFTGSVLLGLSYDEMVRMLEAGNPAAKKARQMAKTVNFGCPGGMRKPSTMRVYARGMGVDLSETKCSELIDVWYRTQPDKVAYLQEYIKSCQQGLAYGAPHSIPIPGTKVIRRGAHRNSAANTGFQGLGAVVEGVAAYRIVKAQLLGHMPGRLAVVVHDENITDCKPDDVSEVEHCQERIMVEAGDEVMSDVHLRVDSAAMSHWSKGAKTLRNEAGQLQIDRV